MIITTGTVWFWFFIHVGVVLVAAAYFTMSANLAPRITERARQRFARRPWLPTLIGVLISVPWVVLAIVLLNVPVPAAKLLGAVGGCLWVLLGLMGGAGIAQQIGARRGAAEDPTWSDTFRGGLFLTLTWVLPIVGWLGMLPLTLMTGIGCLAMGVFPSRSISSPAPPIATSHQPVVTSAPPHVVTL